MSLVISVTIAAVILLFVLAVLYSIRGFKITDLKNENKRLYDKLGSKENESENLKESLRIERNKSFQAEKNNQQIFNALTVTAEEAKKTLYTIKRSYKVSNRNKLVLIRLLNRIILANYSQISIDRLKANQDSIISNTKALLDYIDGNIQVKEDDDVEKLANVIFTLILAKSN